MFKSVNGKYQDITAMSIVNTINVDSLFEVWNNVVCVVTDIGIDMVVTFTDSHLSKMLIFSLKMLKNSGDVCVEKKYNPGNKIIPHLDNTLV